MNRFQYKKVCLSVDRSRSTRIISFLMGNLNGELCALLPLSQFDWRGETVQSIQRSHPIYQIYLLHGGSQFFQ